MEDANAGLAVGLYRSDTDTWSVLPRAPITQRPNVVAVWTDTELIVWGGTVGLEEQRDGAAYNPETNQWRPIANAPFAGASTAAAVWTGHEMIVWGGRSRSQGAAYRPTTDSWRTIADAPIPARLYPNAVWTGNKMIVWGSCDLNAPSNPGPCDHYSGTEPTDGAAYDPNTDLWRPIAPGPLPPRPRPRSVWTGKEMVVWGGDVGPAAADQVGAAYNPKTDSWRRLPAAPLPTLRDFTMLWTGEEVLVLGGQADTPTGNRGDAPFGGAYDPDTGKWRTLPIPPYSTAVWSNSGYAWTRSGLFAIGEPGAHWPTAILPAGSASTGRGTAEAQARSSGAPATVTTVPVPSPRLPAGVKLDLEAWQKLWQSAPGTSDRRCVPAGDLAYVRSGEFVAGTFAAYSDQWDGTLEKSKLAYTPLRSTTTPPLTVTAEAIGTDRVESLQPLQSLANAWSMDGVPFYSTGTVLPHPGNWRLIAEAGTNWGCFELAL